jgi:uncharacterized membrane protein YagU involved in acid resistance
MSGSLKITTNYLNQKNIIMESKFVKAVLAGIVATAVMTVVGVLAPYMGLPKMNPAELLSGMLGVSPALGWIMHFMIGIIFASAYVYWFNPKVNIHSRFWKGITFGFAVFVFAQIMMFLMAKMMPGSSQSMQGNMVLMMIGSLIGHLVYGVFVAWTVGWITKTAGSGHQAAGSH